MVNAEHVEILTMQQFEKTRPEESMLQERLVEHTHVDKLLRYDTNTFVYYMLDFYDL